MDVCSIHHSVLTCKIYIIPCCHRRSIADETLPFFLIKFIFRMIETGWLQPGREELFWQCALRCGSGALFDGLTSLLCLWPYHWTDPRKWNGNTSFPCYVYSAVKTTASWSPLISLLWFFRPIISYLLALSRQVLKLILSFVHFYCFTFCISFSFSVSSSWEVTELF